MDTYKSFIKIYYLKDSLGRNSDKLPFLQIKIYIYEESEKVKI